MQTENWICQTEKYWNEKRPWWLGVASKQNQSRLARPWLQIETRVTLILGNIQNSITARIKYLFKHKLRSVTLPIRSLSVFFLLWCWNPGFNKSAVSLFTLIIHSFRALNRIGVCTLVEAWRSPKLTEEASYRPLSTGERNGLSVTMELKQASTWGPMWRHAIALWISRLCEPGNTLIAVTNMLIAVTHCHLQSPRNRNSLAFIVRRSSTAIRCWSLAFYSYQIVVGVHPTHSHAHFTDGLTFDIFHLINVSFTLL